jgi:hypothetical protein
MPIYKANNKVYNIPDDKIESFIQTNPEAILMEEEVKIEGAPSVDAAVAPEPVIASESTELDLETPSSVSLEETDESRYEMLFVLQIKKN